MLKTISKEDISFADQLCDTLCTTRYLQLQRDLGFFEVDKIIRCKGRL